MPYVLDATGLQVKTTAEIFGDMRDDLLAAPEIPEDINLEEGSALARELWVQAEAISESNQLLLEIYASFSRDNAEGTVLDDLNGLVGILREPATASSGTVLLTGTPATVITAGSQVKLPNVDGSEATIDAPATIGGGGTVQATFTADANGPISYPDGSSLTILTPIGGWTGAEVDEPITGAWAIGRDVETDPTYRRRAEESFGIASEGTDQGISANIRALPDVDFAYALSNRGLDPDVNGVPGKATRLVVYPGTIDDDRMMSLAYSLWGIGIYSDGDILKIITDSEGEQHNFRYSVATGVDTYIEVDVTARPEYGGDSEVEEAILTYASERLDPGVDVLPIDIVCQILDDVDGVDHLVVRVQRDGAPGPTDTVPVEISVLEIALVDIARITVAS
jgi:hypothetical protein